MAKVKLTQVKSVIGQTERQRRIMESLGLRKINHSVTHTESPTIRGMITKVAHLIREEKA